MPQNALLRWNFAVPDVGEFTQPIMQGLQDRRRQQQLDIENRRADENLGMQRERLGMDKQRFDRETEDAKVARLGKEATAIHQMQGPQRQAMWQRWTQSNPDVASHMQRVGIDPNDHVNGPQFIATEAGSYDAQRDRSANADINVKNAHAEYYRGRANLDQRERWKLDPTRNVTVNSITGETRPIYDGNNPLSKPDPLAGVGLDKDGNIVTGHPSSQALIPGGVPIIPAPNDSGKPVAPYQGRMNLGGPIDDIERSTRLDEGRPEGVRVAQAGGGVPSVPGVRPELMDQAMSRFGRTGMTSPEVPGMVTDAGRNRRVDVTATREMQGQRAFNQATPEQQDRLMKFRQDQELWTGIYKRQPRSGYYYGEDGREMPLTDKNFKGDRESQAVALLNMNKIEAASKRLIDTDYFTRTAAGALNIGQTGQAFADMKQGAMGLAYALSGKTIAVAEMKNFIEAYGPTPGDGAERIKIKTERMRQFYQALLTASRGGESYETAFARALSATGVKNPDGTPAGQPAAASGGMRPPPDPRAGVKGMTDDELINRVFGR